MDTADALYKELSSWRTLRESCIEKLRGLANEIEQLAKGARTTRAAGNSGARTRSWSAFFLTALVFGPAASVSGTAANAFSSVVENVKSSVKLRELKEIVQRDILKGKEAEALLAKLQKECVRVLAGSSAVPLDPSLSTQDKMSICFLNAVAKQKRLKLPMSFFAHLIKNPDSHIASCGMGGVGLGSKELRIGFRMLLKELANKTSEIGGAFGLGLEVRDLLNSIQLAKSQPNEACDSLRQKHRSMQERLQKLGNMLDPIERMFEEMGKLKESIEKLTYSTTSNEEGRKIVALIKKKLSNSPLKPLLDKLQNDPSFTNNLCYIYSGIKRALEQKDPSELPYHLDIVFVAHGKITQDFIPASHLMCLSPVEDIVLYSPWNCSIDAKTAYHIAMGDIQPDGCRFSFAAEKEEGFPLPRSWNKLRRKENMHLEIPTIMLSPVARYEIFQYAITKGFEKMKITADGRIVLPYLVPASADDEAFPSVPFHTITLAAAVALWVLGHKATIHLASCLSYGALKETDPLYRKCRSQYAITLNKTHMTYKSDIEIDVDEPMYRAIQDLFHLEHELLILHLLLMSHLLKQLSGKGK